MLPFFSISALVNIVGDFEVLGCQNGVWAVSRVHLGVVEWVYEHFNGRNLAET